jgi:hypothetical protein
MKMLKLGIRLIARWSGVEADIQADQRIETANHLIKGSEFFKAGIAPQIRVANALGFYAYQLKNGNKYPDLLGMRYSIAEAGGKAIFHAVDTPKDPKPSK